MQAWDHPFLQHAPPMLLADYTLQNSSSSCPGLLGMHHIPVQQRLHRYAPDPMNQCHPYITFSKLLQHGQCILCLFPSWAVPHHGQSCLPGVLSCLALNNWINTQFEIPWKNACIQPQPALLGLTQVSRASRGGIAQSQCLYAALVHSVTDVWALACVQCTRSGIAGHEPRPGLHSNPSIRLHPDLRGHWTNKVFLIGEFCEHVPANIYKNYRAILGVTDTLETGDGPRGMFQLW